MVLIFEARDEEDEEKRKKYLMTAIGCLFSFIFCCCLLKRASACCFTIWFLILLIIPASVSFPFLLSTHSHITHHHTSVWDGNWNRTSALDGQQALEGRILWRRTRFAVMKLAGHLVLQFFFLRSFDTFAGKSSCCQFLVLGYLI